MNMKSSGVGGAAILRDDTSPPMPDTIYDSQDEALVPPLAILLRDRHPLQSLFHIKSLKVIVLGFLIANLGFGVFFSYTSPEALSHTFYDTFNIDSKQFGSIFTLYALPNVCMVFITGMLVDVLGPGLVSIVLSTIVTTSALIGAFSPPHFGMMLFSRFLLGFAGESLIACSNTMMTKWFPDRILSSCLGFLVGWNYSANLASLVILPAINRAFGFRWSLFAILFVPSRMWIMSGIVFSGYSALYGLAIIGPDFFETKYGFNEQSASLILSAETLCSSLMSPVFGVVIRKVGQRFALLAAGIVTLALGLVLLITTDVHPLPWVILCGIGFALLNTSIISSLPVFVPPQVLGTAYGLVGTSYNCGLVVFPPILGALKESSGDYTLSLYLLLGLCGVALSLVLLLKWRDLKSPSDTQLSLH
eukprot:gene16734-19892_t